RYRICRAAIPGPHDRSDRGERYPATASASSIPRRPGYAPARTRWYLRLLPLAAYSVRSDSGRPTRWSPELQDACSQPSRSPFLLLILPIATLRRLKPTKAKTHQPGLLAVGSI